MIEYKPVEILKEPCLASGRFVVDKALSDDVFPVRKKLEELVKYRGSYMRLLERVHVFTRIVSILLGASLFGDSNNL